MALDFGCKGKFVIPSPDQLFPPIRVLPWFPLRKYSTEWCFMRYGYSLGGGPRDPTWKQGPAATCPRRPHPGEERSGPILRGPRLRLVFAVRCQEARWRDRSRYCGAHPPRTRTRLWAPLAGERSDAEAGGERNLPSFPRGATLGSVWWGVSKWAHCFD